MKVYVVSYHCWSNVGELPRTLGVYSSREKAQAVAQEDYEFDLTEEDETTPLDFIKEGGHWGADIGTGGDEFYFINEHELDGTVTGWAVR